jgi:hypothetical protein
LAGRADARAAQLCRRPVGPARGPVHPVHRVHPVHPVHFLVNPTLPTICPHRTPVLYSSHVRLLALPQPRPGSQPEVPCLIIASFPASRPQSARRSEIHQRKKTILPNEPILHTPTAHYPPSLAVARSWMRHLLVRLTVWAGNAIIGTRMGGLFVAASSAAQTASIGATRPLRDPRRPSGRDPCSPLHERWNEP